MKSTVDEIRERFDNDVERFSNLDTGQSATIDAPLSLELIAQAASTATPRANSILDIGCGAGNYTLKLLQALPNSDCTLNDLSRPMIERAVQRVRAVSSGALSLLQGDIRELDLGNDKFDIVVAAAVLHHLRSDQEWYDVFQKIYRALRAGGSFWISDLIVHTTPAVQEIMWKRYGDYLADFKGEQYRGHVFDYIEREDTPRSLMFQLDLLREVGFREVEILHKNSCFAAFGGLK